MKAFPVHDSACNDHCREAFRYGGLGLEGRCHCFLGATDFTQPQFFRYSGCSLNLSNMKVGHDGFFEKIIGIPYGRYYYCWLISKQQNCLHFMCGKRNLMPKLLFTLHCLFFTAEFALIPSSSSNGTSIKIHVYMHLIYKNLIQNVQTLPSPVFKHFNRRFKNKRVLKLGKNAIVSSSKFKNSVFKSSVSRFGSLSCLIWTSESWITIK